MMLLRAVARPMLSSVFFLGAVNALKNPDAMAGKAEPVTERLVPLAKKALPQVPFPTDPKTLVRLNAVVQIVAAAGLATGRAPRVSSALLVASLVPTTFAGHAFWKETDAAAKKAQRLQFAKNASVVGGLLLAAADTEGQPGLAWRARHATKVARRESTRLARTARREAKLRTPSIG